MANRSAAHIAPQEIERQKQIINRVRDAVANKRPRALIETYGCAQNVNDSERLFGMLEAMGYAKTEKKEEADLILYNTCAVRENAELRVYGNLGALKALKRAKPELLIGVCGCMMQQKAVAETIQKKYRHVDLVFGTHALYRFPELLETALKNKRVVDVEDTDGAISEGLPLHHDGGVLAGVSVMYGCNNFCTYCIVPYVRGRERSRDIGDILSEVQALSQKGVKEVMLLGQNVNSYGNDLKNGLDFPALLNRVSEIEGILRIRFMTSHPKDLSDALISVIANNPKVCNQLHLPIQCGSNRILEKMNRRYTREAYLEKIKKVRSLVPNVTLTTDIIVGFPGETNEDFLETLDILENVRFDSVFSFIYSKRAGTPAATYPDVLTPEEKKANFNRLLEVQNAISAEINAQYTGKTETVLVEGASKTDRRTLTGRTEGGKIVNFAGGAELVGKLVPVRITEARTWSLLGEIIH